MILCTYIECDKAHALGMESGDINNDQITSSAFLTGFQPWKGRLNNHGNWKAPSGYDWIQIDLLHSTVVTGIITQGSPEGHYDYYATLHIQYGDSVDTLMFILENGQAKVRI